MPCVGEIAHLKAAVLRLKDKPFEILAVSLDDERAGLDYLLKQLDVPGIHTWEPIGWDENPVRILYNVQSMPTWYLLDAKGVIRARNPDGKELAATVEAILADKKQAGTVTKSAGHD